MLSTDSGFDGDTLNEYMCEEPSQRELAEEFDIHKKEQRDMSMQKQSALPKFLRKKGR